MLIDQPNGLPHEGQVRAVWFLPNFCLGAFVCDLPPAESTHDKITGSLSQPLSRIISRFFLCRANHFLEYQILPTISPDFQTRQTSTRPDRSSSAAIMNICSLVRWARGAFVECSIPCPGSALESLYLVYSYHSVTTRSSLPRLLIHVPGLQRCQAATVCPPHWPESKRLLFRW